MPISKIIVVGAGPSGLLLAILLAQAGITVDLLEMTHELDKNPRASHYTDSSNREFDRAGILDELRDKGFLPNGVSWRKMDDARTRLVYLGGERVEQTKEAKAKADRYRMVCLPLDQLGLILENRVKSLPGTRILYGHKVVGITQHDDKVDVSVEVDGKEHVSMSADYVVGCDGGNSTVRKLLFGAGNFPGFTWDKQIVATNMYYDGFDKAGYDDSQFFVHPEHWHMVAKITADGMYRVTYGDVDGLTRDDLWAKYPEKFAQLLPGLKSSSPGSPVDQSQWKVVNFSPYRVHQRCVDKMRVGRVLLAADAAHLCNPFGGLGLTGGVSDVGCLYDSLVGIHRGVADDSILDKYCEVRRRIWHEHINPSSSANMRRLFEPVDPDVLVETDPFLKVIKQISFNSSKSLGPSPTDAMTYDMTQHYSKVE